MTRAARPLPERIWQALILDTEVKAATSLAEQLWAPLGIWPDELLSDALAAAHFIRDYASSVGAQALGRLVGATEANLRRAVATQDGPTGPAGQRPQHWVRNLLLSLRLTTALTFREPARPPQRAIHFGLEPLPARTRWPGRPLADDEAAVLRLLAELDSLHLVEPGPALLALGLSGVTASEASTIGESKVDFAAQQVAAPGHGHGVRERVLPLTPWSARILVETRERRQDGVYRSSVPYAYRGRQQPGKTSAHASASGVYQRMFQRVGIAAPDLKASSVELWLPYRLLVVQHDLVSAQYVSGRSFDSLLRRLNLSLDHSTSYTGHTDILAHSGGMLAQPPNGELQLREHQSRARPRPDSTN